MVDNMYVIIYSLKQPWMKEVFMDQLVLFAQKYCVCLLDHCEDCELCPDFEPIMIMGKPYLNPGLQIHKSMTIDVRFHIEVLSIVYRIAFKHMFVVFAL